MTSLSRPIGQICAKHKISLGSSQKSFAMRSKPKLNKSSEHASYSRKCHPTTDDVKSVATAESSLSSDGFKRDLEVPAADISASKVVQPPLEPMKTSVLREIKIAPIFLQHNKSKQISGSIPDQHARVQQEPAPPPPPQREDDQVKSEHRLSALSHPPERQGYRRVPLSPAALRSCLEEIQTSNPAFSARAVFNTLQKKTCLQLQDSDAEKLLSSPQNHLKEKRKLRHDSPERMPKRLRSSSIMENCFGMDVCHSSAQGVQESDVLTANKEPRSNKLSHTRRLKQQSGNPEGPVNPTQCSGQLSRTTDIIHRESSCDDVLWTEKYSPQHSSEVIGNSAPVKKLQSWLKKWKLRAVYEERIDMEERRREENSNDSWDCGDFQGEAGAEDDREEPLCNTVLITGPPGVGKTASVYACSQELGFKVFEVNCSSLRSGSSVLSRLKEATQSHQVELSGKDPLKPAYFNNYSSAPKSDTSLGKAAPLKKVTSTSKSRAAQSVGRPRRTRRAPPSAATLADFFKMKAKADPSHLHGQTQAVKPEGETYDGRSPGPRSRKTATSLILFEEVDVIFDEDVGFLAAIKTFMTSTKRPVILTTNDPSFRERFHCSLEEIVYKTPSVVSVCSFLQLVGLAESVRLEADDVISLVRLCRGDVRRCLLQLQLWVHSGGGQASLGGGWSKEPTCVPHVSQCPDEDSSVTEEGDHTESEPPQRVTGCTAHMLGLHFVTQNHLLNLLKCRVWSESHTTELLSHLAESWRGGVPLLYSNLEFLLPVKTKGTLVFFLDKGAPSGPQGNPPPSDLHRQQLDGNVNLKMSVTESKSVISRLSRRKRTTKSDTTSSSSLTQTPQRMSLPLKRADSGTRSSREKPGETASRLENECLDALGDFFDLISYLDATMQATAPLVSGSCRPGTFVWTGAEIKDGLLDAMCEEEEEEEKRSRGLTQERLSDLQAAVEGLGCHRCLWRVQDAVNEAQQHKEEVGDTRSGRLMDRLTIPASSKRPSLSFSSEPVCAPRVSQRRYELSRKVLSSNYFGLLGNRKAVSVDYMPVLRHISRSHRTQQQREETFRCQNYLSSLRLGLSRSTIQLLAEDFTEIQC